MKNLSYYLLVIFILMSINTSKAIFNTDVNPLMGYVSFVANDLPEQKDIVDGCLCAGTGKILSGDKLFSKKCPCPNCTCKKPDNQGSIKSDDCDIIKSMYPVDSPYRKFLPKQKGKELWCMKVKTKEDGSNWCAPCKLLDYEFSKMKKTNWTIDEDGTLEKPGTFHIRVVDFEHFEELPSYFTEIQKDKDGNIKMNHDGTQQGQAIIPTFVFWEDGKIKIVHKGFLNSFGMLKLFEGKPIVKGTDDVQTK